MVTFYIATVQCIQTCQFVSILQIQHPEICFLMPYRERGMTWEVTIKKRPSGDTRGKDTLFSIFSAWKSVSTFVPKVLVSASNATAHRWYFKASILSGIACLRAEQKNKVFPSAENEGEQRITKRRFKQGCQPKPSQGYSQSNCSRPIEIIIVKRQELTNRNNRSQWELIPISHEQVRVFQLTQMIRDLPIDQAT